VGFFDDEVFPSPKFQDHDMIRVWLLLWSVKCTLSGACPEVGDAEKSAFRKCLLALSGLAFTEEAVTDVTKRTNIKIMSTFLAFIFMMLSTP
jgi:hypothetical protein